MSNDQATTNEQSTTDKSDQAKPPVSQTASQPDPRQVTLYRRLDELACTERITVKHQGPFLIVFVAGRRVNHLLHAVLSLGTFGLWAIFWIIIAWRGGERWVAMTVDAEGQIRYAPVPPR